MVFFLGGMAVALLVLGEVSFLGREALPALLQGGAGFLLGKVWAPAENPPLLGSLPLLLGSGMITLAAGLLVTAAGVTAAIYLTDWAPPAVRGALKVTFEGMAGMPSVVLGFAAVRWIVPTVKDLFHLPTGYTALSAALALSVTAAPLVAALAEDALAAVPSDLKEASLALGVGRWATSSHITLPLAAGGVMGAALIGLGRILGETMVVLMVSGNAAVIPHSLLQPVRTMPGAIAAEIGEAVRGSRHYHGLFALGVLLLAVNLGLLSLAARVRTGFAAGRRERSGRGALVRRSDQPPRMHGARRWDRAAERLAPLLLALGPVAVGGPGLAIIAAVVIYGLPGLSLGFLLGGPGAFMREGGVYPAIWGTLALAFGALGVALPLGVSAAICLQEYAGRSRLGKVSADLAVLLAGVPSVVYGLIGVALFVTGFGFGRSLLSGVLTLALLSLPVLVASSREALAAVPASLREASLALGVSSEATILHVVLPVASPGILTGAALALGRAATETAPVLLTAAVLYLPGLPRSLGDPVMALSYHLFATTQLPEVSPGIQYATALLLVGVGALLSLGVGWVRLTARRRAVGW